MNVHINICTIAHLLLQVLITLIYMSREVIKSDILFKLKRKRVKEREGGWGGSVCVCVWGVYLQCQCICWFSQMYILTLYTNYAPQL